jgi:hypothetical protein
MRRAASQNELKSFCQVRRFKHAEAPNGAHDFEIALFRSAQANLAHLNSEAPSAVLNLGPEYNVNVARKFIPAGSSRTVPNACQIPA